MPVETVVVDALNAQMGREFEAHLQYLEVSSWFDFIQDVGGAVAIPSLNAPKATFESAEEAVGLSLDWENSVTAHIDAAMDLAREKNDHATHVFLQWFVTEQVEEVKTMSELLQVVRRAGDTNLLLVEEYVARSSPGRDGDG